MNSAKESENSMTLESAFKRIASLEREVEKLRIKTGSRDKTVSIPAKTNYNTDTGPWPGNQPSPVTV